MTDDATLIEALRIAGHGEVADRLRDTGLAKSLREAGHEDVADALERKLTGEPVTEAAERTPADRAVEVGQGLLDQARAQCPQFFDGLYDD
jgi:hypothetical protein